MKKILNRGRTLDAVLHPKNYPPFSKITGKAAFDAAWATNPDWILANMAHAAYCDQGYCREILAAFGATTQFYESLHDELGIKRGRQALLAIWDDKAILSFRGTEPGAGIRFKVKEELIALADKHLNIVLPPEIETILPTDIIDNLYFAKVTHEMEGKKAEVHGGFYQSTNELWPRIAQDLHNLSTTASRQLFVTGHSLGAAMAVIAAMMHSGQEATFNAVVTFGEPAVGNNIGNSLKETCPHIRYVNGDDPIPGIVPDRLFKHHGACIPIQDISGADIKFDHSIINYAEIIGQGRQTRSLR